MNMQCVEQRLGKPHLGLGVGNDDAEGLHAKSEPRETFHELRGQQSDRLGLFGVSCGRRILSVPLVELPAGGERAGG